MGDKGAATYAGTGATAGGGINTYSGVGAGPPVPASDVHPGGISGSRVWCQITSREYTTFLVATSSILYQLRSAVVTTKF